MAITQQCLIITIDGDTRKRSRVVNYLHAVMLLPVCLILAALPAAGIEQRRLFFNFQLPPTNLAMMRTFPH